MLNQPQHRKILFEILREIYSSQIGAWLAFKGGTMLYFFHELDRFSVDLDFDLIAAEKEQIVFEKIKEILKKFGKIKDEKNKHFTIFFQIDYQKNLQNLKIEISKRGAGINKYKMLDFYGTTVRTLAIEDAFAHKMIAATSRKSIANRDFYDIYFLFKKNIIPNEKIIFAASRKNYPQYCKFLINFIEKNFTTKNCLDGLGELIDSKQKIWIKHSLKKELLAQINFSIDNTALHQGG